MQSEQIQTTIAKLTADPGKIFRRIGEEALLGTIIWLGKNDKEENYEEVDQPVEEIDQLEEEILGEPT